MCLQSLILARDKSVGQWPSTTPAFVTGKCTPEQSAALDSILPSTFPAVAANADLDAYATSGTGTGSHTYKSQKNYEYKHQFST